ncbi:Signal transduction histidine kinase [Flavobacterium sp. CF108]|uniref:hybrid sensor histidine kinase/response regulator transcription factor n=1 Tax=unclassified Flavobacterium TaxID=196869 RepID=UPI0008BA9A87|nr:MULTISPECIES: two-component regulator propeller domain-containing protein [unclassified Flavobacterium]SEP04519.1 Signal transduction histidine kinase [Flavobacterium sp. fv08]SHH97316.1 Signal transduction histidine kinase [Flavobacterium sp. CF108]
MSSKKCFRAIAILFFIINSLFSQNTFENYQFRLVDNETSKSGIYTIAQDQFGVMWMGTNGAGLYKYDGINYVGYEQDSKRSNSINSNLIYTVYVDTQNRLWAGTDEGLCLYNRNLDTFENIDLRKPNQKETVISVRSIIEDNNGNIFLGTFNNGLLKLNVKSRKITSLKLDTPNAVNYLIHCLVKDKKGTIYLGTNSGLKVVDPLKNEVKKVKIAQNNELLSGTIISMFFDSKQNLWIGNGYKGLVKANLYSKEKQAVTFPITRKRIMSILAADPETILCATENDGLIIVNSEGVVQKRYENSKYNNRSLGSNSVWSLYVDKEKRIWLGYYNKGLGVFDRINTKVKGIESLAGNPQSLQTNCVTGIAKDHEGQLWISMEGGGVDVYNPETQNFKHVAKSDSHFYSGLTNNNITKVFIDKKQNVWLASWNEGIFFLKKGSRNFINYNTKNTSDLASDNIMSITEDSRGVIWIGTFAKGLHYYTPSDGRFHHCNAKPFYANGMVNLDIRKVMADSDDAVWVGSTTGLYKVSTKDFVTFSVTSLRDKMSEKLKNHKSIHTINTLYQAKNKEIWIGTDGAGLFSYNKKTDTLKWYINFNGLHEKSIASIIESNDGRIWLSGRKGISSMDLKNKTTVNYSTYDGLLGNDFNNNSVLKDENGLLYFGGYEGLNCFNPDNLVKSKKQLPIYFTDLKLFNKSVKPLEKNSPLIKVISETKKIILKHDQSVFTIDFIGINYSFPAKNEFAYYLEGFEDSWNYVGSKSSATYTNLAPGKYVFKVKASEKNGAWSQKPLELRIEILPPWWKTSFAYLFYSLLVLAAIYFGNQYYQNRFKQKQLIQFEQKKALQIEKLNDKKLQFFTNISHEFRTPLTLILNPLADILKNNTQELSGGVLNKLQTIQKSSDRLSRLINELMDFNQLQFNKIPLKVQQLEIVGFTKEIVSYFDEEAQSRGIELQFESDKKTLNDWADPKMFEKIIFNVISNAFKVTPDNGKITVKVIIDEELIYFPLLQPAYSNPSFSVIIKDTGAGLDKKDIKRIFDRFYQVNNLNKAYYGSTGIGLEVVRGFVELHKGSIEVESVLGAGTTFKLIFPIGKEFFNENEILQEEFKKEKKLSFTPAIEKETDQSQDDQEKQDRVYTILIVEDNVELRNYLKNELKKEYKVITAENGQIGLEAALQKQPDLILTDVIMPVMNGLELCKNIKADLKTSHIPLMMLSAKALVKDKLEGIDSGADMYLSKPFDMDILKSSLVQLLKSRQIMFNKFYNGITPKAKEKTTTLDNEFIKNVLNYINENINEYELSVEVLASKVFLSRSQLYRKIKTLTGVSVNEFIRNVRLEKAKELIELGNDNITEISIKTGFSSPSYFTKCYKEKYGQLPTHSK